MQGSSSYLENFTQSQPVESDEYRAYSYGRVGIKAQPMIAFVRRDDFVEAMPYADLNRIWSSDINREIKMDFGGRQVLIEGANLKRIFNDLRQHRFAEIIELSNRAAMASEKGEPVITRLEIN